MNIVNEDTLEFILTELESRVVTRNKLFAGFGQGFGDVWTLVRPYDNQSTFQLWYGTQSQYDSLNSNTKENPSILFFIGG